MASWHVVCGGVVAAPDGQQHTAAAHVRTPLYLSTLPSHRQAEALSLRRALADAQRKLHALSTDTGSMIDRRIVVKMLITYFEKDYSGASPCLVH